MIQGLCVKELGFNSILLELSLYVLYNTLGEEESVVSYISPAPTLRGTCFILILILILIY